MRSEFRSSGPTLLSCLFYWTCHLRLPPTPHPAPATGVSASWACLSEAAERNLSGARAPSRDSPSSPQHRAQASSTPRSTSLPATQAPWPAAKQLGSEVEGTTKAEGSLGAFPSRRGLCPQGLAPSAGFRSGPEVVLTVVGSLLSCYQKGGSPFSLQSTEWGIPATFS